MGVYSNNTFSRKRILLSIYILLSIIVLYRYFFLQIIENEKYEVKSGNNSLRKMVLFPPRGIIYDRYGLALVDNLQIYDLALIPFDVTNKFNYDSQAYIYSKLFGYEFLFIVIALKEFLLTKIIQKVYY